MIAAIVVPAGVRSAAMIRACLVSGCAAGFEDEGAGRVRDFGFLVTLDVGRAATLVFDFDLVIGSSEVARHHRRTTSAPPGRTPGRADPEAGSNGPGRYSNAPIRHEGQSFLSKKVAQVPE